MATPSPDPDRGPAAGRGAIPDLATLVPVGTRGIIRRTISESDVYLFAGVTGDFHYNHVDAARMASSAYGERIAHGALVLGLMSAASTQMTEPLPVHAVSAGYDRVRFLAAVPIGSTIEATCEVVGLEPDRDRSRSEARAWRQDGELVAYAVHIHRYFPLAGTSE